MLKFMPQQTPISMLSQQQLPRSIQLRLAKIKTAYQQVNWETVHIVEQQTYEHWSATGDWWSYGVTLIALGDGALKCQQLTWAEHFYREAQLIFQLRVDPTQRRNEAAATYGLALTTMLSGRVIKALELLERSSALLRESEEHWVMIHADYEQADHCADKRLWMETLTTQIMTRSQPEEEIPYGPFQRNQDGNHAKHSGGRVFWEQQLNSN
ncbi:MAG: hypothetical protein U9Q70_08910 [Chloroflexota bacterium]|nr:hypothetical protein [Chloroflexota bacterium]